MRYAIDDRANAERPPRPRYDRGGENARLPRDTSRAYVDVSIVERKSVARSDRSCEILQRASSPPNRSRAVRKKYARLSRRALGGAGRNRSLDRAHNHTSGRSLLSLHLSPPRNRKIPGVRGKSLATGRNALRDRRIGRRVKRRSVLASIRYHGP